METAQNIIHFAHHRSKNRIRDFGEVFTPEKYVNQMLDMLDKSVWTDTDIVFFEPTSGHGNFVSVIVKKRLKALLKKAKRRKIDKPHFFAVANTLNTLWAIDIDSQNIEFCRNRVRTLIFNFLRKHENKPLSLKPFIKNNKDFLTHILCCIDWQIHENEALSCLEQDIIKAKTSANKTAVSREWLKRNKHRPINFEMSWCQYFNICQKEKIIPIEYTNNFRFISSLTSNNKKPQKIIEEKFFIPNFEIELSMIA